MGAEDSLKDYLCEMVVLMAVSHGCVYDCKQICNEIISEGNFAADFMSTIGNVFRPIQCSGGGDWSNCNEHSEVEGVPSNKKEKVPCQSG